MEPLIRRPLWSLVGLLACLTVATLPSIGLLLVIPLLATTTFALWFTRGRDAHVALYGISIGLLVVTWANRRGPGEVCAGNSTACSEYLDPTPFAVSSLLFFAAGYVVDQLIKASLMKQDRSANPMTVYSRGES